LWRTLSAAGVWGAPQMLSDVISSNLQWIADEDGNITMLWYSNAVLMGARYIQGAWTPQFTLNDVHDNAHLALDGDGNVSMVYTLQQQGIGLRRIAALGTTWTDPVMASMGETGQPTGDPGVGHTASGNPIVVYGVATPFPGGGNQIHLHWRICHN